MDISVSIIEGSGARGSGSGSGRLIAVAEFTENRGARIEC